eukprot:8645995-Ditylum_brightwellii.AAC.1
MLLWPLLTQSVPLHSQPAAFLSKNKDSNAQMQHQEGLPQTTHKRQNRCSLHRSGAEPGHRPPSSTAWFIPSTNKVLPCIRSHLQP